MLLGVLLAAPATKHAEWQAEIVLPSPAPVYRVLLDDELTAAAGQQGGQRIEIIDAQGRSMPCGEMQRLPPRNDSGVAKASALVLSAGSERNARPDICTQVPRPDDCSIFDAAPNRLPPGVGQMSPGAVASGRSAGGGALMGARIAGARNEVDRVPLRFTVVMTQLPTETLSWTKPTLVLRWKSTVAPDEITWQIGRHVAIVTDADRAALAGHDGGTTLAALRRAWWHQGRFEKFGRLKAASTDAGEWEARVPIDSNTAAEPLEIGSAPPGAVRDLSVRVEGVHYEIVDGETSPRRTLSLTPTAADAWHIDDPWPRTTMEVEVNIDADQALMATDAGINRLQFVLRSRSGEEKPLWLSPSMRMTYSFYDAKQEWTELRLLTPLKDFGAPRLDARYAVAMLWFENRGTPPYILRAGALSPRQGDTPSRPSAAAIYGAGGDTPGAPFASVTAVRKIGMVEDPKSPQEERKRDNGRIALLIAAVAALLVISLAAVDLTLSRRLAELEDRR
jgi:hypothetical protein